MGFHFPSLEQSAKFLHPSVQPPAELARVIACHLGQIVEGLGIPEKITVI
jgi:hypothetical protein